MTRKFNCFLLLAVFSLITTAFIDKDAYNTTTPKPPKKWKMGIALYSFNNHPFNKAINMAEEAGVKYVEGFSFYNLGVEFNNKTMGELDEDEIKLLAGMLKKSSLTMSSMYVANAKNEAQWKRFFENGRKLGVKYLVSEPAKDQLAMIDSLSDLYHIKVAIHQHVKGKSIYWHPDSVLMVIKKYKNIGACADLGHWVRSGLDPVKCLNILSGHIIGVHLKDVDKSGRDVDLGKGLINFPGVVKELKKQKFSGTINVECEHNMKNNLGNVRQAIHYFNEIYFQ